MTLTDADRGRTLTVEVWYPAAESGVAGSIRDFVSGETLATLDGLLATAPEGCVNLTTTATRDAAPASAEASGSWPLLLMSHCHNCTRFSTFSLAERLASHGFAVAAPDHEDNTLWDAQDGTAIELGAAFVPVRGGDMLFVLDTLLEGGSDVPAELAGRFDASRVGALGHSFGSVTTGYTAQSDDRIKAAVGLAAPMENPVTEGVLMADVNVPVLFVLMQEDNSISEFGNILLRDNFANANPPAWKIEVADAGHWSMSDICGLVPDFDPCCGDDVRQTDGSPFSYIPLETGVAITQNAVTAFFALHLLGDEDARGVLESPWPEWVTVEVRD